MPEGYKPTGRVQGNGGRNSREDKSVTGKKWAWLKELRFLQLTLYIIFFLFALPFFSHRWSLQLFSSIFLLNALLVSLSASGKKIRFRWAFWLLFSGAVLFSILHVAPVIPAFRLVFLYLAIILRYPLAPLLPGHHPGLYLSPAPR